MILNQMGQWSHIYYLDGVWTKQYGQSNTKDYFILYDAKTLSFDSVVCGQTEVLAATPILLSTVCHFSCHVLDQFMQY